jgi:regulator of sigma E protease
VDRRGTAWKISVLPLGGYVKMYGISPGARAEAEAAGAVFRPQEAYSEKKVWQRSIVAAAGPIANFVLAIVLFALLLGFVGESVPLAVIGEVLPSSAAAQAGLKVGDEIRSADGTQIALFEDLRRMVAASPGRDLKLMVHRDGHDLAITAHIKTAPGGSEGQLGVRNGTEFKIVPMGPLSALLGGVTQTWAFMRQIAIGLGQILTGHEAASQLGGVISIADMSGQVAQLGFLSLVLFIAKMSVNLGLVNLLPIPVLDGGHLMFYAAEALRGRPVPLRAQEYGYRVGIAIIACIFVFASFNDLVRVGAFQWVGHLIG